MEGARRAARWLLMLGVAGGCRPPARCPEGSSADPSRVERLRARLADTTLGAPLLGRAALREHPVCFAGAGGGTVKMDGPIVLLDSASEGHNAARLGHLLYHVDNGAPFPERPDPAVPCTTLVDAALRAEAAAYGLELRLRRELGVTAPEGSFGFEAGFWAAPDAERDAVVLEYFLDHPDGTPGVPGFVSMFTERCERLLGD